MESSGLHFWWKYTSRSNGLIGRDKEYGDQNQPLENLEMVLILWTFNVEQLRHTNGLKSMENFPGLILGLNPVWSLAMLKL